MQAEGATQIAPQVTTLPQHFSVFPARRCANQRFKRRCQVGDISWISRTLFFGFASVFRMASVLVCEFVARAFGTVPGTDMSHEDIDNTAPPAMHSRRRSRQLIDVRVD
jgi:hypothetical protein